MIKHTGKGCCWILLLLALFTSIVKAQINQLGQNAVLGNSFLWKIEKQDQPISYLLGTVHLGKNNSTLSVKLTDILNQVSVLVTEVNVVPESEEINQMGQLMFDLSSNLSEKLSAEHYQALHVQLSSVIPADGVKYIKPWAAFALIAYSKPEGYSEEFGIDMLLTKEAMQLKKKRSYLETTTESLQYFSALPEAQVISILQLLLEHYEETQLETKALLHSYQANQVDKVVDLLSDNMSLLQYLSEGERQFWADWFYKQLLSERNQKWLPKLEQQLIEEPTLIAVGAAHLYGEDGLVNLLQSLGYQLTPVMMSDNT